MKRVSKFLRGLSGLVALVAAIVVIPACGGGGGGGGGNNPVAPPPPPPPPGQVSGNVQGSVIGFNNPGSDFTGTEVEMVGVGTTSINGSGEWGFQDVPVGNQRLEFTGPKHLTRRVNINVTNANVNRYSNIELVEPGPFDLAAFDEIYRSFSIDGTIRWPRKPRRVVLDRTSLSKLPQGLAFFEREVKQAYSGWLPNNTDGFFAGTPVVTANLGPIDDDTFQCRDVPAGEIHIVGIDECPVEDEFLILGSATHCFDTVQNEVVLGAIFFNPCSDEATVEHEIIHTLCSQHLESRPNDSIMGSPGGSGEILPLDRRHMRYVYTRPPGTTTPDDSWGLGVIQPD